MSEALEALMDETLGQFLDKLASGAATPGGGSAAAMSGAMAAGLIAMVCNLSLGKKQLADFEDEARSLLARAEELRGELQVLAQEDIAAFGRLMAAYRLPRQTEADAATRQAAIQNMTKKATDVPLRTARAAAALLPLCAPLARQGNRLAVSDIGVAALLIQATVPSALLNVDINLGVIEDQRFVREVRAQVADLTIGLQEEIVGVLSIVRERMRGA
jgi:formiminotetrahydrofolate cyclodeaminase